MPEQFIYRYEKITSAFLKRVLNQSSKKGCTITKSLTRGVKRDEARRDPAGRQGTLDTGRREDEENSLKARSMQGNYSIRR